VVEELRARMLEAEARADDERRRHAEAEAEKKRLQAEVERLRSGSNAQAMMPCTYWYMCAWACMEAWREATCLGCAGRGGCLHAQAGAGGG
jgi:hypothetical protein